MDVALLTALAAWQHPLLTEVMRMLTWLGSVAVLLPLALLLSWQPARLAGWRHWQAWAFLPLAVTGATLLAQIIKLAVDRARPNLFPALLPMPADGSFPSGHSMQVTAFVLGWLVATGRARHPGVVLAGVLLICVVGFSRLYLQVHYPSDVLLGILGGALWVAALSALPTWRFGAR